MQKTRKDLRKEKRQQKKVNRFNYHNKKKQNNINKKGGKKSKAVQDHDSENDSFDDDDEEIASDFSEEEEKPISIKKPEKSVDKFEQHIEREKKEEKEYYDEIRKNRVEQLQQQNEEEDKVIGRYEKLLKLNKRKRKNGSTSTSKFNDGLDYLLELCTDDSIQKMYSAAKEANKEMSDEGDDEKEVFNALRKAKESKKKKLNKSTGEDDVKPIVGAKTKKRSEKLKEIEKKYFGDDEDFFKNFVADSCEGSDSELGSDNEQMLSDDQDDSNEIPASSKGKTKKVKFEEKSAILSDSENSEFDIENDSGDDEEISNNEDPSDHDSDVEDESFGGSDDGGESEKEQDKPEEWEDIYGRKRDKAGNLIKEDTKYVPPHLRKAQSTDADDPKRREKLQNLRRQIKGYINRLAEANLHRIAIDIENLYNSNARHDVNETLTQIITDSLISNVLAADRIVLEQMLLIATLHANIGSEIGAFFLQVVIEKFDKMFQHIDSLSVENKELDNVIFIICHLYTYRLFKHELIYELLEKLCEKMTEKRVECMLLVLRSIGFILRKDDPLMLKDFIIKVQKLAHTTGDETAKNTRVMFMLDILMAVKNNNVSKIPQYDPTIVEHFRKLLKQFVRAGKYVTTLAVTMEDLLNADERGKWWLVGSAWTGNEKKQKDNNDQSIQASVQDEQRKKIFELARKQRMNTDDKKNLFYILMTAEDYLDAFEKIVSSVKDERTIIAVIVHCCLSEKNYNPYYEVLAQKFCDHNRKFLLAIQFTIWDKIKDIKSLSTKRVTNLAKLLISLIENGNLPLSVLKVIEFTKPDKATFGFLRKVLVGLLLVEEEKFHLIFERIAPSQKLKTFKDQLRLFIKVFLISDDFKISEDHSQQLNARMHLAEKFLMSKTF